MMRKSKRPRKHLITEIQLTFFIPTVKQGKIPGPRDYDSALVRIRPGSSMQNLSLENYAALVKELGDIPRNPEEILRLTREREMVYLNSRGFVIPSRASQRLEEFIGDNFTIVKEREREYLIY